jgi:hypothetical protein
MTDAELLKGTLACACIGLQFFNLVILFLTGIFKKKIFKYDTTFAFVMLCSLLFNLFLVLSYKFLAGNPWGVIDFICLIINCIMICLFTLAIAVSDNIMEDN